MAHHHENGEVEADKSRLEGIHSNNDLTRQMTIPISPEVYERLFFQPTAAKGDLAKRLGNPTLIGLLGFLIPFQTAMFCLLGFRGASPASLTAVSGAFYALGGIAMNVAGIMEWVLGNTFPAAIFIIYGSHWVQAGIAADPVHNFAGVYTADGVPGALSMPYNSGSAFYNLTMMLISFVFFIGSLRTNAPFALALFCLIPLFALLAAADFYLGYHPTAAGAEHAAYLLLIGGGFGFVTALCGWYLAILQVCASTGVPCPLPVFDLSTKIGANTEAKRLEHAGSVQKS